MSDISKILSKAINGNNPSAQNELGMCYLNGDGVEKSEKKAFLWFTKAAQGGVSEAMFNLGICYKEGIGAKKDIKIALKWFEKAFECGDASIALDIASMYYEGDGVKKDEGEALSWYEKAAARGNKEAAYKVGKAYLNGEVFKKDRAKAEKYLRIAAGKGNKDAQKILASEFKIVGDYIDERSSGGRRKPDDDDEISAAEMELNNLIGLTSVKNQIQKIKAVIAKNKKSKINLHMCFNGNPGTGKTIVARIIGKLLHEIGALPKTTFIETDRDGLVSKYVGQTTEKTHEIVKKAMGGVLFIDEAYTLCRGGQDNVGDEAVAALIKDMEDHKGEFCVILAGYTDKMADMIAENPGFKSRIQFNIDFPDYNRDELKAIMLRTLRNNYDRPYKMEPDVIEECLDIVMSQKDDGDFANARTVSMLVSDLVMIQSVRSADTWEITSDDVNEYKEEHGFTSGSKKKKHTGGEADDETLKITTLGFKKDPAELKKAEQELANLVGLESVKQDVKRIKSYLAKNKGEKINLHMAFTGGPGTGKTVVARIISRILYHSGVLPKATFVETDKDGLISNHVGETGKKTHSAINKAMGGVLFIDEAYNLVGKTENDFGGEAVGALLKDMEDYQGEFCTILAGYTKEMEHLFSVNPGFKSRIQFKIEFPDYTRDELREIAKSMLKTQSGGKYTMTKDVLEEFLNVMDYMKENSEDFANARTVRNTINELVMNQNVRSDKEDDFAITVEDIEEFKRQNNIDSKSKKKSSSNKNSNSNLRVYSSGYKPDPKECKKAEAELNALVGLTKVKREIQKLKAFLVKNVDNKINIHMAFTGGPGTGKTVVARLMSRILYHSGVLPKSVFIETDRDGLIGRYVGETGKKTHEVVEQAMGGVLFIDEAYNLVSSSGNDFGAEAVGALLKDMEDFKGEFCTILAGYTNEMEHLFSVNPGFKSRIKFKIEFPNYTREELGEIAQSMLKTQFKQEYTMTKQVLNKFLDVMDCLAERDDFANARTVRNTLETLVMDQSFRTDGKKDDWAISMEDINTFIEEEDIKLPKKRK